MGDTYTRIFPILMGDFNARWLLTFCKYGIRKISRWWGKTWVNLIPLYFTNQDIIKLYLMSAWYYQGWFNRCWWRMLVTKCVGDFKMLATVSVSNIHYLITLALGTKIQRMSPTSKFCHQHPKIVINHCRWPKPVLNEGNRWQKQTNLSPHVTNQSGILYKHLNCTSSTSK